MSVEARLPGWLKMASPVIVAPGANDYPQAVYTRKDNA